MIHTPEVVADSLTGGPNLPHLLVRFCGRSKQNHYRRAGAHVIEVGRVIHDAPMSSATFPSRTIAPSQAE